MNMIFALCYLAVVSLIAIHKFLGENQRNEALNKLNVSSRNGIRYITINIGHSHKKNEKEFLFSYNLFTNFPSTILTSKYTKDA